MVPLTSGCRHRACPGPEQTHPVQDQSRWTQRGSSPFARRGRVRVRRLSGRACSHGMWANLLVQDRELKRPAAASAVRATATMLPEQPEQQTVEPAREPERPASTPRQRLPPGWRAVQHTRQTGRAAGQTYMEYFDAEGNRYRSRKQIDAYWKTME